MNILRAVTLVVIFIKCVTASTYAMSQFREAVDENDMAKAVKLRGSTYNDLQERLNYVVDKKDQVFIFDFAKQAKAVNGALLIALNRKKSPKIIEEALKVFKFDQYDLEETASDTESICSPDNLVKLLGKMENRKDQENAIQDGVNNLFTNKRTECLDPLLHALENNGSLKHLKDIVIKGAFKGGSRCGNKLIVERFHDHPAVTSKDYVLGLIYSGNHRSTQDPIFTFLLEEADQDDLNAVKEHILYEQHTTNEFKKAIKNALLTAKPSGSRVTLPIQRAEFVMKTFKNDSSMGIPAEISQLIAFYLVDESLLKPRIGFIKLIMKTLEGDDSGIRMATVISELIISYLSEESILESITTPIQQTISIKGKERDNSADESA